MEALKQLLPRHGGGTDMDMDMGGMNMGQSNSTSAMMMSTYFTTSFVFNPPSFDRPLDLTRSPHCTDSDHRIFGSRDGHQQQPGRLSEPV